MATRQTAGKSGKRGTAQAARKPRGGTAVAKPVTRPARPGQAPSAGRKAAAAQTVAASPPATARGRAGAAWRAVLRWSGGAVPFSTLIVSLLGLADSAYLTYQHFSESTAFAGCSESGAINCVAVTTSPWSHVGVFPVSVLGLAFFAFMVAVNTRWGWKAPWAAVHWARLVSVVTGIVFVLYLIWAELFRINAICLYCTGVHILTFILFALIVGRATYSGMRAIPDND
ncbi:MAG TPA: vitamin K epoxide reductase family protein [Streptosporangiaceae bacterium]|nr:vitamin K epoxide reductase family protein [Streptosporangiaceae bacterium]